MPPLLVLPFRVRLSTIPSVELESPTFSSRPVLCKILNQHVGTNGCWLGPVVLTSRASRLFDCLPAGSDDSLSRKLRRPSLVLRTISPSKSGRFGYSVFPDEETGLLNSGSCYNTFSSFDDTRPAADHTLSITEITTATDPFSDDDAASSVDESSDYSDEEYTAVPGVDYPDKPLTRKDSANDHVFHIHKFRNQGSGGETWLGRGSISGELVVVKEIADKSRDWSYPAEYRMLVDFLKCESHPNINKILGYTPHVDYTELFYEFANAGDMFRFTKHYPGAADRIRDVHPIMINHFIASMGDALAYLHLSLPAHGGNPAVVPHAPIIHGDFKLENIFLRFPGVNNNYGLPDIILGDFGLSCYEAESYGAFGTPGYMDPDLEARSEIRHEDFEYYRRMDNSKIATFSSDIYAFGVSLYRLGTTDWHRGRKYPAPMPLDVIGGLRNSSFSHPGMESATGLVLSALEHRREDRLTIKALYGQVPYFRTEVRRMFEAGECLPVDAIKVEPPNPERNLTLLVPTPSGGRESTDGSTTAVKGPETHGSTTAIKSLSLSETPFEVDFDTPFGCEDEEQARSGASQPRYDSHMDSHWSESSSD